MASVVEEVKISPFSDTKGEFSLPITFFDMIWYEFPANKNILFFEIPDLSKSLFLETIVPKLKHSLSVTLAHFLPMAGNIIHPQTSDLKPVLRYQTGDSVTLTIAESNSDFSHLTGNHPRNSDDFYAFVPRNLPKATQLENWISCPVLSLQVTLFPGQGLCIGFVTHHAVADASTDVSFMQSWAVINRLPLNGGVGVEGFDIQFHLTEAKCLPHFDRSNIVNINGLDAMYWDLIVKYSCQVEPPPTKFPINKIRTTFVLTKDEIQKLKNTVLSARGTSSGDVVVNNGLHLSSFTVACALVWICSARSCGEVVGDDELEYFTFAADCRTRLNPPMPSNYFGNCVALIKAELKHSEVKGVDGFLMAAESIGKAIRDKVYGDKGILHGAERWPEEFEGLLGKRVYGVAGSPRFDFYQTDYGWGRPKKVEALCIDANGSISLWKSREVEGHLEISLSKPNADMEAFRAVLTQFLRDFR